MISPSRYIVWSAARSALALASALANDVLRAANDAPHEAANDAPHDAANDSPRERTDLNTDNARLRRDPLSPSVLLSLSVRVGFDSLSLSVRVGFDLRSLSVRVGLELSAGATLAGRGDAFASSS